MLDSVTLVLSGGSTETEKSLLKCVCSLADGVVSCRQFFSPFRCHSWTPRIGRSCICTHICSGASKHKQVVRRAAGLQQRAKRQKPLNRGDCFSHRGPRRVWRPQSGQLFSTSNATIVHIVSQPGAQRNSAAHRAPVLKFLTFTELRGKRWQLLASRHPWDQLYMWWRLDCDECGPMWSCAS